MPPVPPDVAGDTLKAHSVSLTERLRTDSTLHRTAEDLTRPLETLSAFLGDLAREVLDPALWLGIIGLVVRVGLILLLAYAAVRLIDKVTTQWKRRFEKLPEGHPRQQRAFTVSNLVSSAARYLVWPVAIIMVLSEFHVDVGALVATAGIAGLAIGFGAQTLVKDVISGIFLLFDDSILVGDLVKIGDDAGTVEFIGVRLIKVRKFDGELLMVPAGELRIFGNRSIGFVRVIVNVALSYEQDIEAILPVMERVAKAWAKDKRAILREEAPTVQAITDFGDSSVNARIIVQIKPGEQFAAERELRVALKRAFDAEGIEIPFPRRTVYVRHEGGGSVGSVGGVGS